MNIIKDLSEKALLVRLSVGMPGNIRQDKRLTQEVIKEKNIEKSSGKWIRAVYPPNALAELTKISGEARTLHAQYTLLWNDGNYRILPAKNFMDCMDGLRKIKVSKFIPAVEEFSKNYESYIDWARKVHASTFNPDDYPPFEQIRSKFRFDIASMPIPQKDDFRVRLGREELESIQSEIDERLVEAAEVAKKDLYERLGKPIEHLMNKLKNPDGKFHDSIVTNLSEIVELIPSLNITEDKNIDSISNDISQTILKVNPQTLRDNQTFRNATAKKAEELYNKLKGYY